MKHLCASLPEANANACGRCKDLVQEEDQEFVEEFVGKQDPSILHFLLASGDEVC